MRTLFYGICSLLFAGAALSNLSPVNAENTTPVPAQDTTLNVIGYFSKNDTLVYWINQSNWKLSPSDTVKTAGISTKIRVTVTDSTSRGYKMDYTFLEIRSDSIADSDFEKFQNKVTEKLGKKIVGTTIQFETDEFGSITKFHNLGKIKKQAKSLFREGMQELMQMPEIIGLQEYGLYISELIKDVDSDKLVDGYLEELKLLFLCHGLEFSLGESHTHEDATESAYENDTYMTVEYDFSDDTYSITTEVLNIIPKTAVKNLVGDILESMSKDNSIAESVNKEFDAQVDEDFLYDSYFSSYYLAHGWPYRVVKQTTVTAQDRGKSTQTYIYLDYINY